jgi:cytochrome c-type biogenesis protein CcsB
MSSLPFLFSTALYLASTLAYLLYLLSNSLRAERTGHYLLFSGFLVHFLSVILRYVEAGYTPITNIHESVSFLTLCLAGFFLYLKRVYKIEVLGIILLPVISILMISASVLPSDIRPLAPVLRSYWLPVHTVFAFLGNAIFFLSFFVSLIYLMAERRIKRKSLTMAARFPPLETLDAINYKCMAYGFPFLTVGIITGSIWAGFAWGSYWSWDPKETLSLITWIVYAILLHNRLAMGWRGRKTAYMMILGFLSIVVTFLGVSYFLGGLHSYL